VWYFCFYFFILFIYLFVYSYFIIFLWNRYLFQHINNRERLYILLVNHNHPCTNIVFLEQIKPCYKRRCLSLSETNKTLWQTTVSKSFVSFWHLFLHLIHIRDHSWYISGWNKKQQYLYKGDWSSKLLKVDSLAVITIIIPVIRCYCFESILSTLCRDRHIQVSNKWMKNTSS
jgi:hypothetical protein